MQQEYGTTYSTEVGTGEKDPLTSTFVPNRGGGAHASPIKSAPLSESHLLGNHLEPRQLIARGHCAALTQSRGPSPS
jgi:hypothetical protein